MLLSLCGLGEGYELSLGLSTLETLPLISKDHVSHMAGQVGEMDTLRLSLRNWKRPPS